MGKRKQSGKKRPERGPAAAPAEQASDAGPRIRPQRARTDGGRDGGLWFYGLHTVRAALANPARRVLRLLATPEALAGLPPPKVDGPAAESLPRTDLERLLPPGAVHQGVAALVSPLPEPDIATTCHPEAGRLNLVVALDQVTDPQNLGAVMRSAAAFGVRAVIVTRRHAPETTGALAKAASGGLELVPLVRVTNLVQALEQLASLGYWRVGMDGGAERKLSEVDAGNNVVLVLGAEGSGLRRLTVEHCDFLARLPIKAQMESLNVSAAAAIAIYELTRTR